jgi:RNA-directed DNA polymerase
MTIIHGRKDKDVLPKAERKPRQTDVSKEQRGGKVLAVEKRPVQLELFATTAEARPETAKAKGKGAPSKGASKPKAPKVANTTYLYGSAEMERVCAGLNASLEKVVSNKGTAGPDRQSVKTVKSNWGQIQPKLVQLLLEGEYHPGDIRRVWIPKAGGGERGLGIPNVIDRVVQEAIRQVIEPRYEPKFHAGSHGFRPNRSCHSAIAQAIEFLKDGFDFVVDIDLKDFFNRVHHQRLLASLNRELTDARVLKLIGRMLKAKVVMPDGVRVSNDEGVPQGGPLSPLLSNIVLDELDKELEQRGLHFVRYADDCNIYVRSRRSGERVMASITRFIEKRLRLEVNEAKSAVAKPSDRHFLGFSLNRNDKGEVEINLSERSKARMRERTKELSPRNWGDTMKSAITGLNGYLKGWMGFFGICTGGVEQFLNGVDAHIRRRLRAIKLKQWKWRLTMLRRLVKLGAKKQSAGRQLYDDHKGIWKLSHTTVVNRTLNNAYWLKEGLRPSAELWKESKLRATFYAPKQMELCLS